ncbi:unnamed protein product [Rotaria magnacalcarata]|uniref:Uncharacterized protein n=3 Tax=Rotaria magnacalcarata TaxID=392030 RepID=A0A816RI18_9BILA|nr:unnamed protein product [Rotaria magnacalcarata]CAF1591209.1 unnamed protein product [Rotaria magnacalcarata]CAF2073771.1 unnamed protein product [Rotaria magnacalcarata]CAF5029987.1 unnamed protein product [Rotaria magnacalcarata]
MFGRCFYRFWYSNSIYEDNCKHKSLLTKFQLIKIITSCAFSPPAAIFTLVTTLQNRHIAQRNREQDLIETKDDQRQRFFVNYINDISRFRDTNIEHLTHNYNKLLYMRTKTLTTLRKLDNERKKTYFIISQRKLIAKRGRTKFISWSEFQWN